MLFMKYTIDSMILEMVDLARFVFCVEENHFRIVECMKRFKNKIKMTLPAKMTAEGVPLPFLVKART